MKTRKVIKRYFQAILKGDTEKEHKLWRRLLKKSLKQKKTQTVD